MARQRTDGARTRERILQAALPLFAEHGYAGTSIRMVSRAADANVATLAYHFDGKDGLYAAAVQRIHEDLNANWPTDPPQDAPSDYVEYFVRRGWEFASAHKVHIRLAFRHVLDAQRHPDVVHEVFSGRELEMGAQILAAVRPDMDASERKFIVLGIVHLIVRFLLEDPDQVRGLLGRDEPYDKLVVRYLANMLKRQLGIPV